MSVHNPEEFNEIDTRDFSAVTPREQVRDLLYQAITALEKQMHAKTLRMNRLTENNHTLPTPAKAEWDALLRDLSDLARDVELITTIAKHQI